MIKHNIKSNEMKAGDLLCRDVRHLYGYQTFVFIMTNRREDHSFLCTIAHKYTDGRVIVHECISNSLDYDFPDATIDLIAEL